MSKKIIITESQMSLLKEQMTNDEIDKRMEDINTNPSEAQKKAGNYSMAHVYFSGFKITIENAKGSKRYWKDEKGKEGYNIMKNHYGYFPCSLGHDGDHVDVFLGKNQDSDKVYVVDQNKKDGSFDESKVMLGFDSKKEAKEAYLSNFTPDWKGFRAITGVPKNLFKKWLYNGRKQQKPFSEYVDIIKKKLNENKDEMAFQLYGDYTEEEKKRLEAKKKKSEAAKKSAETRAKNKAKKQKEEEEKYLQLLKDKGIYKGGLFDE